MMRAVRVLLSFVVLVVVVERSGALFSGIPGSQRTEAGYDVPGGTAPICWLGQSIYGVLDEILFGDTSNSLAATTASSTRLQTPVMDDFEMAGDLQVYSSCPEGTTLLVETPTALLENNNNLLANRSYTFTVNGTLDLSTWPADIPITDEDSTEAAVHIVLCDLRNPTFCSPFLHYNTADSSTTTQLGDLHGGNHIDSAYIRVQLESNGKSRFVVPVSVQVNQPGTYSVLAAAVFVLTNERLYPNPLYLASVSNMPQNKSSRVVEYGSEPTILNTSSTTELVSYVLIGLAGIIMLFLLFSTFRSRKQQVMMLTQGNFLCAMLFFGLWGMAGSIFFNPKSDLYCNMLGPMLIVPMHIFYSIILARLWRIHAVISPLLLLTLDKKQSFTTRVVGFLNRLTTCQKRNNIRRTVTNAQLARVICLWASPQIILQILSWALDPDELIYVFNEDMTKGSAACDGLYYLQPTEVVAGVLLLIQFLTMWILARQSQDLPSLFNEASVIFDVTLVSVIILVVATIVNVLTTSGSTSPDVQYIIGVLGTLAMISHTSMRLVVPKLQMVWRGDTIIVTKLIADHNREARRGSYTVMVQDYDGHLEDRTGPAREMDDVDDDASDESSVVLVQMHPCSEELDDEEEQQPVESSFNDNSEPLQAIAEASLTSEQLEHLTQNIPQQADEAGGLFTPPPRITDMVMDSKPRSVTFKRRPTLLTAVSEPPSRPAARSRRTVVTGFDNKSRQRLHVNDEDSPSHGDDRGYHSMPRGMFAAFESVRHLATDLPTHFGSREPSVQSFEIDYNPRVGDEIVISETEPPTRRLLLRMIEVQRLLTQVNRTVLAGVSVPKEEWDSIRRASVELGSVFEEDVQFEWETRRTRNQALHRSASSPSSRPAAHKQSA